MARLDTGASKEVTIRINRFIALVSNARTLKFKAKLTITFYAAVNHRNGHLKAETSKIPERSVK